MIISHKYKFIFIKTFKTAGTSVEAFLSQHCTESDILPPIDPSVVTHVARNYEGFFNPIPELIATRMSVLIAEKGKFIRETFWQLVKRRKFYKHMPALKVRARLPKEKWESYYKFCVERNPWDKVLSSYHMVKSRRFGEGFNLDNYFSRGKFPRNYPLYTDRDGRIIVDRIVKYENFPKKVIWGLGENFQYY